MEGRHEGQTQVPRADEFPSATQGCKKPLVAYEDRMARDMRNKRMSDLAVAYRAKLLGNLRIEASIAQAEERATLIWHIAFGTTFVASTVGALTAIFFG